MERIDVNDRLPDEGIAVLVQTHERSKGGFRHHVLCRYDVPQGGHFWADDRGRGFAHDQIAHWWPLPLER